VIAIVKRPVKAPRECGAFSRSVRSMRARARTKKAGKLAEALRLEIPL